MNQIESMSGKGGPRKGDEWGDFGNDHTRKVRDKNRRNARDVHNGKRRTNVAENVDVSVPKSNMRPEVAQDLRAKNTASEEISDQDDGTDLGKVNSTEAKINSDELAVPSVDRDAIFKVSEEGVSAGLEKQESETLNIRGEKISHGDSLARRANPDIVIKYMGIDPKDSAKALYVWNGEPDSMQVDKLKKEFNKFDDATQSASEPTDKSIGSLNKSNKAEQVDVGSNQRSEESTESKSGPNLNETVSPDENEESLAVESVTQSDYPDEQEESNDQKTQESMPSLDARTPSESYEVGDEHDVIIGTINRRVKVVGKSAEANGQDIYTIESADGKFGDPIEVSQKVLESAVARARFSPMEKNDAMDQGMEPLVEQESLVDDETKSEVEFADDESESKESKDGTYRDKLLKGITTDSSASEIEVRSRDNLTEPRVGLSHLERMQKGIVPEKYENSVRPSGSTRESSNKENLNLDTAKENSRENQEPFPDSETDLGVQLRKDLREARKSYAKKDFESRGAIQKIKNLLDSDYKGTIHAQEKKAAFESLQKATEAHLEHLASRRQERGESVTEKDIATLTKFTHLTQMKAIEREQQKMQAEQYPQLKSIEKMIVDSVDKYREVRKKMGWKAFAGASVGAGIFSGGSSAIIARPLAVASTYLGIREHYATNRDNREQKKVVEIATAEQQKFRNESQTEAVRAQLVKEFAQREISRFGEIYGEHFSGDRWNRLLALGAGGSMLMLGAAAEAGFDAAFSEDLPAENLANDGSDSKEGLQTLSGSMNQPSLMEGDVEPLPSKEPFSQQDGDWKDVAKPWAVDNPEENTEHAGSVHVSDPAIAEYEHDGSQKVAERQDFSKTDYGHDDAEKSERVSTQSSWQGDPSLSPFPQDVERQAVYDAGLVQEDDGKGWQGDPSLSPYTSDIDLQSAYDEGRGVEINGDPAASPFGQNSEGQRIFESGKMQEISFEAGDTVTGVVQAEMAEKLGLSADKVPFSEVFDVLNSSVEAAANSNVTTTDGTPIKELVDRLPFGAQPYEIYNLVQADQIQIFAGFDSSADISNGDYSKAFTVHVLGDHEYHDYKAADMELEGDAQASTVEVDTDPRVVVEAESFGKYSIEYIEGLSEGERLSMILELPDTEKADILSLESSIFVEVFDKQDHHSLNRLSQHSWADLNSPEGVNGLPAHWNIADLSRLRESFTHHIPESIVNHEFNKRSVSSAVYNLLALEYLSETNPAVNLDSMPPYPKSFAELMERLGPPAVIDK